MTVTLSYTDLCWISFASIFVCFGISGAFLAYKRPLGTLFFFAAAVASMFGVGCFQAHATWEKETVNRRLDEERAASERETARVTAERIAAMIPVFEKQGAADFTLGIAFAECPYRDWKREPWESGWLGAKRAKGGAK